MTAPEVHVTIDRVVLGGLSRGEGAELVAALRAGLQAAYAGQPAPRTQGRAARLGQTAARRIAEAGRP